ncbi:MAG: error-prone DNA polymerase [Alphaproteobacteria bacterium]|nr:error-prone DNA polymerase [Alphaproteobacteria bacterium]
MTAFAELAVTTNFSFLRGASHPREMVAQAAGLGYAAIGIADRNTLAGVVRAYSAHEELKEQVAAGALPKLLIGCRLAFVDGTPDILAYPVDRDAYGRLCRLLSDGKLRAPKGECLLTLSDLLRWQEGLLLVVLPPHPRRMATSIGLQEKVWNDPLSPDPIPKEKYEAQVRAAPDDVVALIAQLPRERTWLGAVQPLMGDDARRLQVWRAVAARAGVPLIATNDVLYHEPGRRALQDVVTCIREGVTLNEAGRRLEANGERYLKHASDMAALFEAAPEAIAETVRLAERISFSLSQLKYNYPDEPVPPGKTPQRHLEDLAWAGAAARYNGIIPENVDAILKKELALIEKMEIAQYFLTVHDIVHFARQGQDDKPPILCQGRGSAANSAVCYMLGITSIDPVQMDLLFERFVSEERKEPPDIDVDFEHERREEVIQYIYRRYGHHRAALAATVIHYRPRSAIREVAKVFGLSEDVGADLASGVWGSWGSRLSEAQVRQGGKDPFNSLVARTVLIANELIGFPRHLSQHVGGFVLTNDRLDECVPISPATMEDRHFIEWDKDDIDAVRMMKVDVLGLGMLTCVRKAFDLIKKHEGRAFDLANVPQEDERVYDMLCKADAVGVFQVESRAQMSMLPRLKPREFYHLVIEVAIVRPGPIQGGMVHPYLRRRAGLEDVVYPSPAPEHGKPDELVSVLGKTLGVPLFQEQAMKLAMVAARFTPPEANGLRRAMATFRNLGTIDTFKEKFVGRMVERGYERDFAERCFKQIEGFGSYGFPESHAASFALLVYVSAYIKCFHPAAFACALLNSQPMGFYAPAEIVRDAREHGVEVRHVDVNFSDWDNTLESDGAGGLALRLGLRQVDGFQEKWAEVLVKARGNRYGSVGDVARRARLPKRALIILAEADCFQSQSTDRRETLWDIRRLADDDALPLFAHHFVEEQPEEDIAPLPVMPLSEHVLADYRMLRLSLRAHLMAFLREMFRAEGVKSCLEIGGDRDGEGATCSDGDTAACAGIVLTRQMPGDAGVVFITLSDETAICNVVVWPRLVEPFRREIMGGRLLLVEGKVQKSPEGVVHLVAERIVDRTAELERLSEDSEDQTRGDAPSFRSQGAARHHHPRNVRVVPKSRDFH